jgi:hypothetical protein
VLSLVILAAAVWPSSHAAAQRAVPLERVEQGIGDLDPLRTGRRVGPVDLRQPLGFDAVYRLGEADAFRPDERPLVRMSGALTAVFPRSVYAETPSGLVPRLPPGTVFHIGPLPPPGQDAIRPRAGLARPADLSSRAVRPSEAPGTRVESGIQVGPGPEPDGDREEVRTIFGSEAYRCSRLAELLREASAARTRPGSQ